MTKKEKKEIEVERMTKKLFTAKDIAVDCDVTENTIIHFIKFCNTTGYIELPDPVPYAKSKYTYTELDSIYIIKMFKNKKRGAMAEYNLKHKWGAKVRKKYKNK